MIDVAVRVKKYGGTSIGFVERIRKVARHLVEEPRCGGANVSGSGRRGY